MSIITWNGRKLKRDWTPEKLIKVSHYCYLRYCKSKSREAKLFYMNVSPL